MEFTKVEMNAVEIAVDEKRADDTRELEALELVMVGGGSGSVVW